MNTNYRIAIKALQNGYFVETSRKVLSKDTYDGYSTRDEEFVFTTWDQVIEFVKKNELEIPPKAPVAE